jgi:hypothetical protein
MSNLSKYEKPISYYITNLLVVLLFGCALTIEFKQEEYILLIFNSIGFLACMNLTHNIIFTQSFIFEKIDSPFVGIFKNSRCLMCGKKRRVAEHICIFCYCKHMKESSFDNKKIMKFIKNIHVTFGKEEAEKMIRKIVMTQFVNEYIDKKQKIGLKEESNEDL